MHRLSDIHLTAAIAGKVGGSEKSRHDAGRKQFSIPRAVIAVQDPAGTVPPQDLANTLLHCQERQPIATCRHCAALFAIACISIWTPRASPNPFNQIRGDLVSFYRQGMVGIRDESITHALEITARPQGKAGRIGEMLDHGFVHLLPQQSHAVHVGRGLAYAVRTKGDVRERVSFSDCVPRGCHRSKNVVGYSATSNLSKCPCETLCNHRSPDLQEACQKPRGIADRRQASHADPEASFRKETGLFCYGPPEL